MPQGSDDLSEEVAGHVCSSGTVERRTYYDDADATSVILKKAARVAEGTGNRTVYPNDSVQAEKLAFFNAGYAR